MKRPWPPRSGLSGECELTALMSETAAATDSRFGRAQDHIRRLEEITGREVIRTIAQAERVGPGKLFDVLVIAPCTGNTMAKLAAGITDSAVTMAAKAHLRNGRPVVVAFSTNDALSGSAPAIAALLNRKNYYFVPFGQGRPAEKTALHGVRLLADRGHRGRRAGGPAITAAAAEMSRAVCQFLADSAFFSFFTCFFLDRVFIFMKTYSTMALVRYPCKGEKHEGG